MYLHPNINLFTQSKDLQYTNEIFVEREREREYHPHPPRWQVGGAWDSWCLCKLVHCG